MHPSLLLLTALSAATASAQCDYANNKRCINPDATTSAKIPFSPLFPSSSPPTFTYAIDELSPADISALKKKNSLLLPAGYTGPVLQAAWWLQYDASTVNKNRGQERRYYAFALETASTGKIGGAQGGCVGLLGEQCVKSLKEVIARGTYDASPFEDGGLGTVVSGLYGSADNGALKGCPGDIFGGRAKSGGGVGLDIPLMLDVMEPFAVYSGSFSRDPLASGGPSSTHGMPQLRLRSLAEQKSRGVVAVTVSWPWSNAVDERPTYKQSDVTVETVCLRVNGN